MPDRVIGEAVEASTASPPQCLNEPRWDIRRQARRPVPHVLADQTFVGCARDHLTSGLGLLTAETTSRMACVVAAASCSSTISELWVAPAMTRCTLLVDSLARVVLVR
jgi:hypothetical protein